MIVVSFPEDDDQVNQSEDDEEYVSEEYKSDDEEYDDPDFLQAVDQTIVTLRNTIDKWIDIHMNELTADTLSSLLKKFWIDLNQNIL